MSKKKGPHTARVPSLLERREEADAGAQFAIAWAEANGFSLAIFRREHQRVIVQLGPAPGAPKPSALSKQVIARSMLAGVLFLDLRRRRGCYTALPWIWAITEGA